VLPLPALDDFTYEALLNDYILFPRDTDDENENIDTSGSCPSVFRSDGLDEPVTPIPNVGGLEETTRISMIYISN
jgi:hypothetical protein